MGKYVDLNLTKGEIKKYEAKVSVWSLLPKLILGLLFLRFYGIGLFFWGQAAMFYFSTELVITNKRVVSKFGFIKRKTIEINIEKVESILIDQGVLGRVFDYGDIILAGAGEPKTPIPSISGPLSFRKAFLNIQEETICNKSTTLAS